MKVRECLTAAAVIALTSAGHGQQPSPGPEFVPGEVLVQFRPGATGIDRAAAKAAVRAVTRAALRGPDGGLELVRTEASVADAVRSLQALPQVEFAEPNWIVRHQATSNDPFYTDGSLWGMSGDGTTPANQFGSQAGELWARDIIGSSNVFVGVIDQGIDFNHPDLAANIWTNPFDALDGVDNDGNGKIDDIHGWDFFENNNTIYDGSPSDLQMDAHGTHVSGTIGGKGGNGQGVAGVNWNVTIISGKFLGPGGGTTANAILAVEYFTDLKVRHGLNIVATSNSWGGGDYSEALHQAIIRAAKQNILFIAAAGNATLDNDAVANYPSNYATNVAAGSETAASYDAVIAVASITSTGAISSFSNFGATTVDIGAPGSDIFSTTPQGGYSSYSGTSMATPHVTGAAAIYKSMFPNATANDIRDAILTRGASTPSLNGITVTGDRLNVGDFAPITTNLTINDVAILEGHAGTKNATFTLSLSETSLFPVLVDYTTANGTATAPSPVTTGASNPASITIPSLGNATPYPSTITGPGGLSNVQKVTATLTGFSHTFPSDVDVLLVGPGGQSVILMSNVGSQLDATSLTFVFDDAGSPLGSGTLASGTYRPTNIGNLGVWPSPAPSPPYGSALSVFNGLDPAGTWSLYVVDAWADDLGSISGGWSLTFTTPGSGGDYVTKSGTATIAAGATSAPLTVAINGDMTIEPNETFFVNLSNPVNANLTDAQGQGTILNDDFAPFTDTPLSVGATVIKVVHITELRSRINGARTGRGLDPFSFTDPTLTAGETMVKAVHILELRTALAEAYTEAGMEPPTYAVPTPAAGVVVFATALTELRNAVLALEGS